MNVFFKVQWSTIEGGEVIKHAMLANAIEFERDLIILKRYGEVIAKIDTDDMCELHITMN